MNILEIMRASPVMPVIVLNDVAHAVPLARALVAGGIRVLEVTMRTPAALDCVCAISAEVPEAIIGVGTIKNSSDLNAAIKAGAQFGVSPGTTPALLAAIRESALPFLPGTMTPSNVMSVVDAGFHAMKLFPAQQAGGIGMLKALGSVFADVQFCPTGGITATTAAEYLALPNVACVGGSWLAPAAMIENENWQVITRLAKEAHSLKVSKT